MSFSLFDNRHFIINLFDDVFNFIMDERKVSGRTPFKAFFKFGRVNIEANVKITGSSGVFFC